MDFVYDHDYGQWTMGNEVVDGQEHELIVGHGQDTVN